MVAVSPWQLAGTPPRRHVPEMHRAFLSRRGELPAVGAEGQVVDMRFLAPEFAGGLAGRHIPEPHPTVPGSSSQQGAVGAEGDATIAEPVARRAGQHVQPPAPGHVPDVDPVVAGDHGESPSVAAESQGCDDLRFMYQRTAELTAGGGSRGEPYDPRPPRPRSSHRR